MGVFVSLVEGLNVLVRIIFAEGDFRSSHKSFHMEKWRRRSHHEIIRTGGREARNNKQYVESKG